MIELDVNDHDSIKSAVAHAETEVGSIDILVNNSGVSTTQRIQDVSPDDYDYVFNTNVKGAFFVAQEVGKRMLARATGSAPGSYTGGRIINVASMAGLRVLPQIGVYGDAHPALAPGARHARGCVGREARLAETQQHGRIGQDLAQLRGERAVFGQAREQLGVHMAAERGVVIREHAPGEGDEQPLAGRGVCRAGVHGGRRRGHTADGVDAEHGEPSHHGPPEEHPLVHRDTCARARRNRLANTTSAAARSVCEAPTGSSNR